MRICIAAHDLVCSRSTAVHEAASNVCYRTDFMHGVAHYRHSRDTRLAMHGELGWNGFEQEFTSPWQSVHSRPPISSPRFSRALTICRSNDGREIRASCCRPVNGGRTVLLCHIPGMRTGLGFKAGIDKWKLHSGGCQMARRGGPLRRPIGKGRGRGPVQATPSMAGNDPCVCHASDETLHGHSTAFEPRPDSARRSN